MFINRICALIYHHWLQVHDFSPNWRKVSIVIRISNIVANTLEIDLYSLENNFVQLVRVKIELVLNKSLMLGAKILLSISGFRLRVVWNDFWCERLPRFCYHCRLIIHDTKICMSGSGLNIGYGGRHINFEKRLCSNLNMCTHEHGKGAMSPFGHVKKGFGSSPSSGDGNGSYDKAPNVSKCMIGIGSINGDEGVIDPILTIDAIVQARRINFRVVRKKNGSNVSSGKLVAFGGGKRLFMKLDDIFVLSCAPNDTSQFENYALFCYCFVCSIYFC